MSKNKITKAKALAALAAIQRQFGVTTTEAASGNGPQLMTNYESMSGSTAPWAIVWEGGPYEWSIYAFEPHVTEFGHKIEGVTRPAGIYAEAINHYALGLYRVDDAPEYTPKTWEQLDADAAERETEQARREIGEAPAAAVEAAEVCFDLEHHAAYPDTSSVTIAAHVRAHVAQLVPPVRKGMRAQIYRSSLGDCSNGGLSSRVDQVTVVGPGIPQLSEPTDDAPAVELGDAGLPGNTVARPRQNPAEGHTPWMSGGTFIHSSDSRFPYDHPIRLHDRSESWSQYDALTR